MNPDAVIVGLGNPGPRYGYTRHNAGFLMLDMLAQDLKNPGPRYGYTRHNAGFLMLDMLAQDLKIRFSLNKTIKAEVAEGVWNSKKVLLMKPLTFMNLSGESVNALYQQQNHLRDLPLVVAHDEVDLEFGRLRIKFGGGDAGHNGLKSIRALIGTGDFYRVRLGVGKPPADSQIDLKDYVLQNFNKKEEDLLIQMLDQGLRTTIALLEKDLGVAQAIASKDLLSQKPEEG